MVWDTDLFAIKKFRNTLSLTLILLTASICAVYSVLLSTALYKLEDHLINNQLQREFEKLSAIYDSLPNHQKKHEHEDVNHWINRSKDFLTDGIKLYTEPSQNLPSDFRDLPYGVTEIEQLNLHLLVRKIGTKPHKVILAYDANIISELDKIQPWLTLILSIFSILVVVLSVLVSIFASKNIAAPIVNLSKQLQGSHPKLPLREEERYDEIGELARTFSRMIDQLNEFLVREQQFTRHASHELRTPLTLISNSLSVLKLDNISNDKKQRNLQRINQAVTDMSELIETFLILGREDSPDKKLEAVTLDLLILSSIEKLQPMRSEPEITILRKEPVEANYSLVVIILDNLLKNANKYCHSRILIKIEEEHLIIENDIREDAALGPDDGFGFGIEIVERIVEKLHWKLSVEQRGNWYSAKISFNR